MCKVTVGCMDNEKQSWETYWGREDEHEWWERPDQDVLDLIRSQSPVERPHVLDLGCGLGRHAIAFAQAGYRVTATDASDRAIEHVSRWAKDLGLAITTKRCDMVDQGFSPSSFDIVVSYNVLYHGRREQFASAITHVHTLLEPGGLFFFTRPTRQDGKYGYGERVAPHTYLATKSITPGDIHYFADETDLDALLVGFRLLSRKKDAGYWDNQGIQQFYSNWYVLAERFP
jgi:tellurite methyltransferase